MPSTNTIRRLAAAGIVLAGASTLAAQGARPTAQMVDVGANRRIAIYCEGTRVGTPTVLLLAGGGRPADDWSLVQPSVARMTRVCSYDYANFGASDRAGEIPQPFGDVVSDLRAWILASRETGPFIVVGHSIAGIYAREFATRHPQLVAGFVFVDSSHEEQTLRLRNIDPVGAKLDALTARLGFFTTLGQRLTWETTLPVIALRRGQPFPRTSSMSEEQFRAWDLEWKAMQEDLVARSPRGELRLASASGHFIQRDEPAMVIQAISDVLAMKH